MANNCHFTVILAPISCIILLYVKNRHFTYFEKTEGGKANVINPLHSGCYLCLCMIGCFVRYYRPLLNYQF